MDLFINEADWDKGGMRIWAERLIYFPKCYNI